MRKELSGWFKMHRAMLNWGWWDDHNVTRVFLFLLLSANHKSGVWMGIPYKPGQVIISWRNLAAETGLSLKSVRIAISKLERTQDVAHEGHGNTTVFTINNWKKYQSDTKQGTERGSSGATDEEVKEVKERINISFDDFWAAYGKRKDKKKCRPKWNNLSNKVREEIMNHVPRYVAATPNVTYRKNPYTYLNSNIWEDEDSIEEPKKERKGLPPNYSPVGGTVEEQWERYEENQKRAREFAEKNG